MVYEIKKFKLDLAGHSEPITLSLDFKAIAKLSKLYGNAYIIIGQFLSGDMSIAVPLIRCCADIELTEEEIEEGIPFNFRTMDAITTMFNDLIGDELLGKVEGTTEKN